MKKIILLAVLCGGALAGCSSSPDVSDVKATLEEGWGECKGLKFSDLKKTNGIDHGKSYELAVSYKLEVLNDVTAEQAWQTEALCPSPGMLQLLWAYGKADGKFGKALKKGDIIAVGDSFQMIKSEKGWIRQ